MDVTILYENMQIYFMHHGMDMLSNQRKKKIKRKQNKRKNKSHYILKGLPMWLGEQNATDWGCWTPPHWRTQPGKSEFIVSKLHCLGVADMPIWPHGQESTPICKSVFNPDPNLWRICQNEFCRIKTHKMKLNTSLKWQNLLTLSHSQNILDMGSPFALTSSTSTLGKKMSKIVIVQNLLPHSLGRIKQKKPHNNNYGEWIPRKNFHGYCTQLQTNAEISSFTAWNDLLTDGFNRGDSEAEVDPLSLIPRFRPPCEHLFSWPSKRDEK